MMTGPSTALATRAPLWMTRWLSLIALLLVWQHVAPAGAQSTMGAPSAQSTMAPGAQATMGAPGAVAADRLATIKAAGVIRVGTTGDYKPFTFRNPATGDYEGMDIDAARLFAQSLGVKAEFVQTSWPTLMADLAADRYDLAMGGITRTEERAKVALLSSGYLADGKTQVVRAGDKDKYRTIADIDKPDVRVATNPGGTNEKFDRANFKNAQIVVFEKNLLVPQAVADGKADVFITDGVEAILIAKTNPALVAVDPTHPFTHDEKGYLLHQADASLLAALNAWEAKAQSDGTYARLRAKWIGGSPN